MWAVKDTSRRRNEDDPSSDPWCHVHHMQQAFLYVTTHNLGVQVPGNRNSRPFACYWPGVIYITQPGVSFHDNALCLFCILYLYHL